MPYKDIEKRREAGRKYYWQNIEKERIRGRKNHPEKIKAQRLSQKIPLKNKCEICGSIIKLERHHWRYDKPFLVNTLCQECHKIQHMVRRS